MRRRDATTRQASYVEPVPIAEEFVSGCAFAEVIDGMLHVGFYSDHIQPPELGLGRERQICKRLVMPAAAAQIGARMVDAALHARPQPLLEVDETINTMPA